MRIKLYEFDYYIFDNDPKSHKAIKTIEVDTSQEDWRIGLSKTDISLVETTAKYNDIITMGCTIAEPQTETEKPKKNRTRKTVKSE